MSLTLCEDCGKALKYDEVVWMRRESKLPEQEWEMALCVDCYAKIYPGRIPVMLKMPLDEGE